MGCFALYSQTKLLKIIPISAVRTIVFDSKKEQNMVIHIFGGLSLTKKDLGVELPEGQKYNFTSRVNYTVIEAIEKLDQEKILQFMTNGSSQNTFKIKCSYIS